MNWCKDTSAIVCRVYRELSNNKIEITAKEIRKYFDINFVDSLTKEENPYGDTFQRVLENALEPVLSAKRERLTRGICRRLKLGKIYHEKIYPIVHEFGNVNYDIKEFMEDKKWVVDVWCKRDEFLNIAKVFVVKISLGELLAITETVNSYNQGGYNRQIMRCELYAEEHTMFCYDYQYSSFVKAVEVGSLNSIPLGEIDHIELDGLRDKPFIKKTRSFPRSSAEIIFSSCCCSPVYDYAGNLISWR